MHGAKLEEDMIRRGATDLSWIAANAAEGGYRQIVDNFRNL